MGAALIAIVVIVLWMRRRRNADFIPLGGGALPAKIGPYRIDERLREESAAIVYRARNDEGQPVILKVLPEDALDDANNRRRFERELRAYVKVHHPNICGILDFSMGGETPPYLAVESPQGETLDQILEREGRLAAARAVAITIPLVQALGCLHENGIIYRNLHPRNVLVQPDGFVKLTDFALARLDFMPSLAATTTAIAEPQMMSPEQLTRGQESTDHRSDLYSVGVLMYRMLGGRYPFDNANVAVLLKEICESRRSPLEEVNPAVPRALCVVVNKLLERTPDARYETANGLAEALKEVETRLPASAP